MTTADGETVWISQGRSEKLGRPSKLSAAKRTQGIKHHQRRPAVLPSRHQTLLRQTPERAAQKSFSTDAGAILQLRLLPE